MDVEQTKLLVLGRDADLYDRLTYSGDIQTVAGLMADAYKRGAEEAKPKTSAEWADQYLEQLAESMVQHAVMQELKGGHNLSFANLARLIIGSVGPKFAAIVILKLKERGRV